MEIGVDFPELLCPKSHPEMLSMIDPVRRECFDAGRRICSAGSSSDEGDVHVGMRPGMFTAFVLAGALICGCGGGGGENTTTPPPVTPTAAAAPTIASFSNSGLQNGAVIVSLGFTTPGSVIHYTLDGSTPTTASQIFQAPFLVSTNLTIKAIASASGYSDSAVTSQSFTPNIASGALVWSDEFSNSGSSNVLPDAKNWTYDTGFQCCGNNEQETYCAAGSTTAPCDPSSPNAYLDTTGILHVMARNPTGTTLHVCATEDARDCSASNTAASRRA